MNDIIITEKEIVAPEGCYLTQKADVDDGQRLFLRRRVRLAFDMGGDWRVATEAEKAQCEARVEETHNLMI